MCYFNTECIFLSDFSDNEYKVTKVIKSPGVIHKRGKSLASTNWCCFTVIAFLKWRRLLHTYFWLFNHLHAITICSSIQENSLLWDFLRVKCDPTKLIRLIDYICGLKTLSVLCVMSCDVFRSSLRTLLLGALNFVTGGRTPRNIASLIFVTPSCSTSMSI